MDTNYISLFALSSTAVPSLLPSPLPPPYSDSLPFLPSPQYRPPKAYMSANDSLELPERNPAAAPPNAPEQNFEDWATNDLRCCIEKYESAKKHVEDLDKPMTKMCSAASSELKMQIWKK